MNAIGFLCHFDGLIWLLICLAPLIVLQRSLHRELQAVFYILTRRPVIAIGLYSLLFFPGVLLHESSHYLMARLLRVKTGRVSLIPQTIKGGTKLQLGFVETVPSDLFRDSLIGAAPLITGGCVMAYIGLVQMNLIAPWLSLIKGNSSGFIQSLTLLPAQPDFWIWFYLAFVISSTMLPSPSDRRAWLPLLAIFIVLLILGFVVGIGPWMTSYIEDPFNQAMRGIASIFGISLAVHAVCWIPAFLIRVGLSRLTGLTVT